MGLFKRWKGGLDAAKKFGDCAANHPEVWKLGTEIAEGLVATRSDYLVEETRTEEGANKYARHAAEGMLGLLGSGSFSEETGLEFPEEVTDESATCFGIAIAKRIYDLLEDERRGKGQAPSKPGGDKGT